ncbi:hypothetical protein [Streptomyces sp. H27-C3]|uniref:hypothetical protein n=1 Tax=Streptomyces sp. H27-C3 TaxID=3046305 RepID=UPI0024BA544E|nr:hypothetical protein [Streptomyces sp. H27-C3]MDJ0463082.1 hypothetical protein [Streptomyces sp. H27-C3]
MHFHIASNTVGQPPSETQCAEDEDGAVLAMETLLGDQMDEWAERCAHFGNDPEWVVCSCAWCDLALNIERYSDGIGDNAVGHVLRENGTAGEVFYTPDGVGVAFWIKGESGARCAS